MPIYLDDVSVVSKITAQCSALIIPCYMCPAVTVSVKEEKPFLQFFSHFLKSPPFERHIKTLQSNLEENGVSSSVFKSHFIHQWFLCMWSAARQGKLQNHARRYDTVVVLGCESATRTVRDSIGSTNCKLIEGMETTGIMNTKLSMRFPCDICFKDSKVIPFSPSVKVAQPTNTEPSSTTVAKTNKRFPRLMQATG